MEFNVPIILVRNFSLSKKPEREITKVSQLRMDSKMVNERIVMEVIVVKFDCVDCACMVCGD